MTLARAITIVLMLLAMSAGAAWLVGRSGYVVRVDGGPLACDVCDETFVGAPTRMNHAESFGSVTLENRGSSPARLEAVRLVQADDEIDLVGALVVVPSGEEPLIGSQRGYPPRQPGGTTHRVEGFVQILIGARIRRNGHFGFRGVAVDYRVGWRRYTAVFEHGLGLCAPPPRDACRPSAVSGQRDD